MAPKWCRINRLARSLTLYLVQVLPSACGRLYSSTKFLPDPNLDRWGNRIRIICKAPPPGGREKLNYPRPARRGAILRCCRERPSKRLNPLPLLPNLARYFGECGRDACGVVDDRRGKEFLENDSAPFVICHSPIIISGGFPPLKPRRNYVLCTNDCTICTWHCTLRTLK
jgi:hypothetical protein